MLREEVPRPVDHYRNPVARPRQEPDMDKAPKPPCRCPRQAKRTEIGDRRLTPDCRKAALMPIGKWAGTRPSQQFRLDHAADVCSGLFCSGCEARNRIAIPRMAEGGIADGEHIPDWLTVRADNPKKAVDLHPARTISLRAKPLRGRRCRNARRLM